MKRVVVATRNKHKVDEIRAILNMPQWEFVSLDELGITDEPVEDADSFTGNARIKTLFAHKKTGLAALADDSGLAVDALDGAPGVYSSRYAGEDGNDEANNAKLLDELANVPAEERSARFVCSLCFIDEDGSETLSEGRVEGRIALSPRGSNGFGYDPLFEVESLGFEKTTAELSPAEKNALSHRFRALDALKGKLYPSSSAHTHEPQVQIAAFDFDGTLIDGSSPVRLIARLNRDKVMGKWDIFKSMMWGLRYKLGWELDQATPRRYIFSSFKDHSVEEANELMRALYFEVLKGLLRPAMVHELKEHQAAGREVIIVSASFEPIIAACSEDLGVKYYICTQMEKKNGFYTGETAGLPPESAQKLVQFTAWANETYGKGAWKLSHAYGDHFSDVPLLETAEHPLVVDPDRRLKRIAKERGWSVAN